MYIINENDFNRDCMVANNKGISSDGTPSLLTQLIDGRSRLYLKNLLGYKLFKDLDENITDGILDEEAPQKWKDFINGVEYEKDNILLNWQGLKYQEGAFNQSVLRYFVYDAWLKETLSASTNFGQIVPEAKNSINVGSTQKVVTNWNKFVWLNQHENTRPYANRSIVNGVEFIDWYGSASNDYVSVVKFIKDRLEDYPDAPCMLYNIQNQFGL